MTKIGGPTRVGCIMLALLLVVAPVAQAKRWRDQGRDDEQSQDQGQGQGQDQGRGQRDRQNNYAPRDYVEPRSEPQRSPGMSMDSAVAQARREGRVLSADVVDEGNGPAYRIKVLTPDGRVRVLYFSAGR